MDNSKTWYDFMTIAQSLLLKGQTIDSYRPNIQMAKEPSFDNSFFLQLVIYDDKIQWYRSTWLRLVDAPKFSDPMESLKYVGQTIKPTIKHERGITLKENLKNIVESVQELSIKPRLDRWGGIMLDGIAYTLIIGVESVQTTYKWHYLPDNWSDLQKLADQLEELNNKLLQT